MMTTLLVILVIAVVAFAVWYVMNDAQEDAQANDAGLEINLGSGDSSTE